MQAIIAENNLSETTFSVKNNAGKYEIRWFSPFAEVQFCGHTTLATTYVLSEQNPEIKELIFNANAVGDLTVTLGEDGYIQMSLANRKPEKIDAIPENLLSGLSIIPLEVNLSQQAYFAVYANENDVRSVVHNFEQLKQLAPYDVVVTATANDYDFISRYFLASKWW